MDLELQACRLITFHCRYYVHLAIYYTSSRALWNTLDACFECASTDMCIIDASNFSFYLTLNFANTPVFMYSSRILEKRGHVD